ncbi:MAG: OmpP1/FadL family transporter [Mangrovibacterium sp.]
MKKLSLVVLAALTSVSTLFAGGLVTNSNQSAQYIRMGSRNASTEIDAVYYNPAGLTQMRNGWHFSLNSQTVFQDRTIQSTHPLLSDVQSKGVAEYVGEVRVPVMPSFFAAYKKGKSAFSFYFGVPGGGGTAEYATGLPSFESQVAGMPVAFNQMGLGTTGYQSDIYFNGSSTYYGFQLNYSYEVNEALSLAAGFRTIVAANAYEGHIAGIKVNPNVPAMGLTGGYMLASDLIATLQGAGVLTAAQGAAYGAMVADKNVDAAQNATGFTPILSAHIKPNERWDIAAKYEFRTKLLLENDTKVDDTGMYKDGAETRADIPAILAFGLNYHAGNRWILSASTTTYFDEGVEWGKDSATGLEREIDKNTTDYNVGVEYKITEKFKASAGWQYTDLGIGDNWRNDITHSFATHSVGAGVAYAFTEKLALDLAVMNTFYEPVTRNFNSSTVGAYTETYDRSNFVFAIGVSYSIFK